MSLKRRALGHTGLSVTELGFGGAPLGNLFRSLPDETARATLAAARAAGFGYFDTAPFYGFGLSERRMGDALRGGDFVLSSKVGRLLDPVSGPVSEGEVRHGYATPMPFEPVFDYSHDAVMRSHAESLQRLGLAQIDMLYIHDIGRMTHGDKNAFHMAELTSGGGLKALEELRAAGAIAGFGMGVNEIAACLDVMEHARLDVILLAGRYTLLEQTPLDALFPAYEAAGTAVVIGGPFNSGILAAGSKSGATFNYEAAPKAVIEKVAAIEAVCDAHGVPLPAAALQFPLAHPLVASVIPGLDSPARVAQAIALYNTKIPAALWADLKAQGLLRADAPRAGMIIDAHQHFWDPARGDYGWLKPDNPIHRVWGPDDLQPLMQAAGVDGTILVQAAPTPAETDYMLGLARRTPWILGVVGWIDLEAPDAAAQLRARAADPLFLGVRPMLQDIAQPDWILRPELAPALAAIGETGLVFDALVLSHQIGVIGELARRHPALRIVLDHGAKPKLGDALAMAAWRADIASLALCPNMVCKLSGLLTELTSGAGMEQVRDAARTLLELFGPQRLLWGSDWPVLTLAGDYQSWFTLAMNIIGVGAADAVMGANAARIYRPARLR